MNGSIHERPCLTLQHANCKGTGCALRLSLFPATTESEGFIEMTFARQMSTGYSVDGPSLVRFNWDESIDIRLGFDDLCKMLQVFRGEVESIHDGKGIHHKLPVGGEAIRMRHCIEPSQGYLLEVQRAGRGNETDDYASVFLPYHEALGLCHAFESSIRFIAFGK